MYTVAQVADPEFAHSWHEAVAIVQEVASQLDPGVSVPSPEDLLLDEEGTLSFGFASESSESPVTSLGRLLKALLAGTAAPAGLRDLADENSGDAPAQPTVAGFCKALSFYERPNRANDLLAIAGRLAAFRPQRTPEAEPERQREDLFVAEPESAAVKPPEPVFPPEGTETPIAQPEIELRNLMKSVGERPEPAKFSWRYTQKQARAAATAVALAAVMIFLAGFAMSSAWPPAPTSAAAARTTAETPLDPVDSEPANGNGNGEEEPSSPALTSESVLRVESPRPVATTSRPASDLQPAIRKSSPEERPEADRRIVRTSQTLAARSDSRSDGGSPPRQSAGDRPRALEPPSPASTRTPPPTVATDPHPDRFVDLRLSPPPAPRSEASRVPAAIYTNNDARVQPPRLMRPQLPTEPVPVASTGFFDIIVNERGLVDQVKLLSPTGHYHDRMMVAAAKAWKFRPALLDGRPVRFRMLIPIIIPEKK